MTFVQVKEKKSNKLALKLTYERFLGYESRGPSAKRDQLVKAVAKVR